MKEVGTVFQKPFRVWRTLLMSRTALSTRQQPLQTYNKGFWALSKSAFFTKQGTFSALNLCQVLFSNSSPFAGLGTWTTRKHRNGKTQSSEDLCHLRKDLEVSPRAHLGTGHTFLLLTESRNSLFSKRLSMQNKVSVFVCVLSVWTELNCWTCAGDKSIRRHSSPCNSASLLTCCLLLGFP